MSALVVCKRVDQYWVRDAEDRDVAGPFTSNAEAWRALDRLEGAPVNPSEKRTDWFVDKTLKAP